MGYRSDGEHLPVIQGDGSQGLDGLPETSSRLVLRKPNNVAVGDLQVEGVDGFLVRGLVRGGSEFILFRVWHIAGWHEACLAAEVRLNAG